MVPNLWRFEIQVALSDLINRWWFLKRGKNDKMANHTAKSSFVLILSTLSKSSKNPLVTKGGKKAPKPSFEASQKRTLVTGPLSMGATAPGRC